MLKTKVEILTIYNLPSNIIILFLPYLKGELWLKILDLLPTFINSQKAVKTGPRQETSDPIQYITFT